MEKVKATSKPPVSFRSKDFFPFRTFPRRNWSLPGYFSKPRFVRQPGEERKIPRVERRELKRGPPK